MNRTEALSLRAWAPLFREGLFDDGRAYHDKSVRETLTSGDAPARRSTRRPS